MNKSVLFEYDSILLGNQKTFSPYLFEYGPRTNQRTALGVFQYVIEYYLKWKPEVAALKLDKDVVNTMKLNTLLRFIQFPAELDANKDFFYIVHLIYPHRVKYNTRELVLNVYKKVLSGDLHKFPKEYMSGTQGITRACICLQYMIQQYYQFDCLDSLYNFFASPNGLKALKDRRLYAVCKDMFEYPIDYLHESLAITQKNEFLYNFYRFKLINSEQIKKLKKEQAYVI